MFPTHLNVYWTITRIVNVAPGIYDARIAPHVADYPPPHSFIVSNGAFAAPRTL